MTRFDVIITAAKMAYVMGAGTNPNIVFERFALKLTASQLELLLSEFARRGYPAPKGISPVVGVAHVLQDRLRNHPDNPFPEA